jgi:hypothetical protein
MVPVPVSSCCMPGGASTTTSSRTPIDWSTPASASSLRTCFRGQVATEPEDAERLSNEGDAGIAGDVAWAAIDRLAEELGPDAPIGVSVGRSGGVSDLGRSSVRDRARATVAYYGTYYDDSSAIASAPLLGHFAEEDPFTSEDDIRGWRRSYRRGGPRDHDLPLSGGPGTGSPSHRATPTGPRRRTLPSNGRSHSSRMSGRE